ncbi:MAG: DedA family protein [Candidatus Woesearchaeota archaeon]
MIFEALSEFFTDIISSMGYFGVFLLMTLESMIAPVPSEAVMPFAGFLVAQGRFNIYLVILASSFGSIVGSLLSYFIGYKGRVLLMKYGHLLLLRAKDLKIAEKWFSKHGEKTIFVCRFIPVIRHLISVPAGTAKMNLLRFSIYTLLGATIWNVFLLFLGIKLQENWTFVHEHSVIIDFFVILIGVVAIFWFLKTHIKELKNRLH